MSEPLTREMRDISFNNSFGFRPKAEYCCDACAFGSRYEHGELCTGWVVKRPATAPRKCGETITVRKPRRFR